MPLRDVTLSEIKNWRTSLPESTLPSNAAAYHLLRSILVSVEEKELIDRTPSKIRGASTARVLRVAVPATLDEIDVITDAMPDDLKELRARRNSLTPAGRFTADRSYALVE